MTSPAAPAHLLGLDGMNADEIRALLRSARAFLPLTEPGAAPSGLLRGRTVANLFFEDSTRTRLSFSVAAQRLSAGVVDLGHNASVNKGETLLDTALNVDAMGVVAMVIRHASSGAAALVARRCGCAAINGGDGRHEHPTQGLLDAYTVAEAFQRDRDFDLAGLRVAIVGDLAHSRVARSDIAALTALGARVVCVGPPTLAPAGLARPGCEVAHDLDAVLPTVDAVQVLRLQFERASAGGLVASVREYAAGYQLSEARAALLRDHAVVMHPGPMNRGVEIASAVADGPRSRVLRQVRLGLAVRMAALARCVGAAAP